MPTLVGDQSGNNAGVQRPEPLLTKAEKRIGSGDISISRPALIKPLPRLIRLDNTVP